MANHSAHAQVDAAPASNEARASPTRAGAGAGAHARRAARAGRKLATHGSRAHLAPVAQVGRTDPGSLKPMLWSERTVWPYRYRRGDSPLIVSIPHAGTFVPHSVGRHLGVCAACRCDTDWHLPRLYDFLGELGATVIVANLSRYVIDVNRPPDGANLYPGRDTPKLCPTDKFDQRPL